MGKSAPKPTDPMKTAAAQTGTNVATATANAYLGNVDQYGPDGSKTHSIKGYQNVRDPASGKMMRIPQFEERTTLSDAQQAIKSQSDGASLNLATLANDQSAFLNDYMDTPFQYSTGDHEAWAGGLYDDLNSDANSQSVEALRTQLANQGIKPGSEAYDRSLENLYGAQGNNRSRFMLDSYNTGMNTALTERNQPLNEIGMLTGAGQVSQPRFGATGGPQMQGTDVASIIANSDNQKMNAWQQNQAAMGSMLSGIGGLFALSDERAKTDKKKIAETKDGLGIYEFKYRGSPKTEIGLMAQEVAKSKPRAVRTRPDGLKEVNYSEALA